MSDKRAFMFVNGCANGRIIETDGRPDWAVAQKSTLPARYNPAASIADATFKVDRYQRVGDEYHHVTDARPTSTRTD